MKFGTLPYRATTYYGQVDAIQTSETGVLAELVTLLEELKKGERECVQKLVPFLTDESFDVRQYSQQLFAHVCCHTDVHAFRDCLEVAEDEFETARIAFRLGETLSPSAIPILRDLDNESESDHVRGAVEAALRLQLGEALQIESPDFEDQCSAFMRAVDDSVYYYHGGPAFIGNVCRELVTAVLVANREQRPVVLVRQPLILANSSGLPCPLQNGDRVDDELVAQVYSYVQQLASMGGRKARSTFTAWSVKHVRSSLEKRDQMVMPPSPSPLRCRGEGGQFYLSFQLRFQSHFQLRFQQRFENCVSTIAFRQSGCSVQRGKPGGKESDRRDDS